jgi:hypothetical protein
VLTNDLSASVSWRSDDFSRLDDLRNRSRIVSSGRKWSIKSYSTVGLVVRVPRAAVGTADFKKLIAKIPADLPGSRIVHHTGCLIGCARQPMPSVNNKFTPIYTCRTVNLGHNPPHTSTSISLHGQHLLFRVARKFNCYRFRHLHSSRITVARGAQSPRGKAPPAHWRCRGSWQKK